jgi:hypothetical protein
MVNEIEEGSSRINASAQGYQILKEIFEDAGVNGGKFEEILEKLNESILKAPSDSGLAKSFENIGIAVADIQGKGSDEVFRMISEGVAKAGNQGDAFNAVLDIMGSKYLPSVMEALTTVNGQMLELAANQNGIDFLKDEDIRVLREAGLAADDLWTKMKIIGAQSMVGLGMAGSIIKKRFNGEASSFSDATQQLKEERAAEAMAEWKASQQDP